MAFSAQTRSENIDRLKAEKFDLVIIGGGITGAGVARDAASRGMKVALVEASDFASGTSSRSSKLIHGGIRYLENLEFGLVFEALTERSRLFYLAPHLVHPLRFMLPLYEGQRVGMFKMGLGMWLYDALSLFETPELHERLGRRPSLERMPMLQSEGLKGSFVYSDAYMDDDRLVIETMRSAAGHGTRAVNFVKATSANFSGDGKMSSVVCRDELSGEEFCIEGRHFVSSVGPWTDLVGSALLSDWQPRLRPSKGIHITLSRDRLPLSSAVVMAADKEDRIVFAIPRHEMVIIGTTDTDYDADPAKVHSNREDIEYLLNITAEYFPGAMIKEQDIIASYAGVRPLVDDGASTESKTSREHVIIDDPRGISFISGGKYTTYRHMAEEMVEVVLSHFGAEERVQFAHSQTKEALNPLATVDELHKAEFEAEHWAAEFGLSPVDTLSLAERHGMEALNMIEAYNKNLSAEMRARSQDASWIFEAYHAIDETMCLNLIDFYLRRSPLFLSRPDNGESLLEPLSRVFAEKLTWSDAEREKQIDGVHNHAKLELNWKSN